MKTYKIDGEVYELQQNVSEAPDAYSRKGKLLDDVPKGKLIGYVIMDDGSCIECYKSFNPMIIILPIIILLLGVAAFLVYVFVLQPKDFELPWMEVKMKEGEDQTVITYNAFTIVDDEGNMDLNFTNGAEECTVTVTGDGIEDATFTCAPYGTTEFVPIKVTTDEGLVVAKVTITTATSTVTNEIAIEVPANYTPDSNPNTLDGYWKGEYIYGVPVQPTE